MLVDEKVELTKLDMGCGPNKKEGFTGVDVMQFDGKVDIVCDLRQPWQWADDSVDEIHCSHFIEHLEANERIHFFNELYRVMKKGCKAQIITPHWSSCRAYGDLTHKWPPVSEMFFYYLSKKWRSENAPHVPFTCDFEATWGYSIAPLWQTRNQEAQSFAVNHYKEVVMDTIATITKQ